MAPLWALLLKNHYGLRCVAQGFVGCMGFQVLARLWTARTRENPELESLLRLEPKTLNPKPCLASLKTEFETQSLVRTP